MLEYRNAKVFAQDDTENWFEKVFVIRKVKNTFPQTYVINGINGEEIIGTFYEKELQKANQKEFMIEKVIQKKAKYQMERI